MLPMVDTGRETYPFDHVFRLGTALYDSSRAALFVVIPKSASTSLLRTLLPVGFRLTTAFRSRPVPEGVQVLAVVREPLGRWMSAMAQYDNSRPQTEPFEAFAAGQLHSLVTGAYRPADQHLTPQSTFLLPTMPVTRWLRFEHLGQDFGSVASTLDLPVRIGWHNRAASAKVTLLRSMMSDVEREAVRRFYADDVRLHQHAAAAAHVGAN